MTRQLRSVVVLVLVAMGMSSLAWAQDQRQYVVVYVEFKPAQIEHGTRVLQELATVARQSPGSIAFTVVDEIERANRFALLELWTTSEAFENFTGSPQAQMLLQLLDPLLAAPLDQRPGFLIR